MLATRRPSSPSGRRDHVGKAGDPGLDPRLADGAVAEDEPRAARRDPARPTPDMPIPAVSAAATIAASSRRAAARRGRGDPPTRRPVEVGEVAGERVEQRVASVAGRSAASGAGAGRARRADEVGERELVEGGRAHVGGELRAVSPSTRRAGATSQPSRSPGASVLLAEPA